MTWLILLAALPLRPDQAPPPDIERAIAAEVERSANLGCDPGLSDEITVCGKTNREAGRFRLPLDTDRDPKSIPTDRSQRMQSLNEGRSGAGVCAGAIGAAGFTGCSLHEWKKISGKE